MVICIAGHPVPGTALVEIQVVDLSEGANEWMSE